MKRMRAFTFAAVLVTATAQAAQAQQDYPSRTVTVVNPTQAGATTDVLARALVLGLSSRLGQQFVVVNRTGASGAIGTASVARAAPDGYTLLFGAVYVLSVLPAARSNDIGYEAHALIPVCQTVSNAMVIAVRPDSPFRTLADLVAAARAQPGKLNYGHQGAGSIPHLSMEEFLDTAKLDIKGIPGRGDPAVVTDLLGGSIDVAALVQGTVAGQNLRLLGIFAEERHPSFADTPTVKEQGFDVAPISLADCWRRQERLPTLSLNSNRPAPARPRTRFMPVPPSAAASRRTTTPIGARSAAGSIVTSRPNGASSRA